MIHVVFRKKSAAVQLGSENCRNVRSVPLNLRLHVFVADFHTAPGVHGCTYEFAVGAGGLASVHLVQGEVLWLLLFAPILERSNGRPCPPTADNICTGIKDLV